MARPPAWSSSRSGGAWCHTSSMSPTGSPPPGSALAPDLYRGESTTEPDGAGKLMMALNLGRAAKDLSGAVDLLLERTEVRAVGTVGYCMGGGLALVLACHRPGAVKATAPYYGVIRGRRRSDWSALDAKVVGEYAELDEFAGPEPTARSNRSFCELGKDATLHIHSGCHHAFFNDTRPGSTTPSTRRRRSAGPSGVPHRAVSATPGVGL